MKTKRAVFKYYYPSPSSLTTSLTPSILINPLLQLLFAQSASLFLSPSLYFLPPSFFLWFLSRTPPWYGRLRRLPRCCQSGCRLVSGIPPRSRRWSGKPSWSELGGSYWLRALGEISTCQISYIFKKINK